MTLVSGEGEWLAEVPRASLLIAPRARVSAELEFEDSVINLHSVHVHHDCMSSRCSQASLMKPHCSLVFLSLNTHV